MTRGLCICTAVLFLIWNGSVNAAMVNEGYFAGSDLQALGQSRQSALVEEPAAVIIFTLDAENNNAVASFDQWFREPGAKGVSIYGVVVEPEKGIEVVSEVMRQRELQMPVFYTSSRLLGGERLRVVLLDGGKARIVPGASPATVKTMLTGGAVTPAPVAATAVAAAAPTPTPLVEIAPAPTPASLVSVVETTSTVEAEPTPSTSPLYVNTRHKFSVKFPTGWMYTPAKNGDGAVAKPPPPRALDLRVWAAPSDADAVQSNAPLTPREYAEQHLEFIGGQNESDVVPERRLVVNDGNLEGRDYVFRFSKRTPDGSGRVRYRGRIQVFFVDGAFKAAGVEAPAEEFDAARGLIEDFMLSFQPLVRDSALLTEPAQPEAVPLPPPIRY